MNATLKKKLTSRKFWLTLAAQIGGGYLISQGHVKEGTALIALAQGTYNVGQGMADAKEASIDDAVKAAIEGLVLPRQN